MYTIVSADEGAFFIHTPQDASVDRHAYQLHVFSAAQAVEVTP
jgi:hypothetical protein